MKAWVIKNDKNEYAANIDDYTNDLFNAWKFRTKKEALKKVELFEDEYLVKIKIKECKQ